VSELNLNVALDPVGFVRDAGATAYLTREGDQIQPSLASWCIPTKARPSRTRAYNPLT
jgi:hypothetical protein